MDVDKAMPDGKQCGPTAARSAFRPTHPFSLEFLPSKSIPSLRIRNTAVLGNRPSNGLPGQSHNPLPPDFAAVEMATIRHKQRKRSGFGEGDGDGGVRITARFGLVPAPGFSARARRTAAGAAALPISLNCIVPVKASGTGAEVPGAGAEVPGTGREVPGTGREVPGTDGEVPGTDGEVPGTGGEVPGTGGEVPGTGGEVPGTGGDLSFGLEEAKNDLFAHLDAIGEVFRPVWEPSGGVRGGGKRIPEGL